MKIEPFTVKAKVWLYEGDSPWHFVTIDKKTSGDIKKEYPFPRRGFGSIPVNITIGKTTWRTSIFPERAGTYVLPLKKEVRNKENIAAGDQVKITFEIIT